ncbi:hypothetical protein HMPREF0658_0704 [Hoylesella marshii DSM 16973 = JCM 13450]|uniref:Uncharacterized protein n=1 Tax=Hoylesella marshii DSM 16973 = JCM 13450 TaxID=862515 RepID=E0NRA3_9BACT|nr:hypothetical protein HMPREF0658_0704 [Hoylesella marshii DSM 16973 = JCM 13450]
MGQRYKKIVWILPTVAPFMIQTGFLFFQPPHESHKKIFWKDFLPYLMPFLIFFLSLAF